MGIVRHKLSPAAAAAAAQRLRQKTTFNFIDAQANAWSEVKKLFDESRFFAHPPETANGPGATMALTEDLRAWLPELFARYHVKTILDVPCGDMNWMQHVNRDGIGYAGWDVEPEIIDDNIARFGPMFSCVNLLTVPKVAKADLILCRDFLICLPNDHVAAVLDKFKASGSRYLLTSHYPDADNDFVYKPEDFAWLGYVERPINLEAAPFNLGPKLEAIEELPGPGGVISSPHELALFQLNP